MRQLSVLCLLALSSCVDAPGTVEIDIRARHPLSVTALHTSVLIADKSTSLSDATYDPPADIPNGNDDDVVARQLREAALHEPDAALREKMWDEYRKYTGLKR